MKNLIFALVLAMSTMAFATLQSSGTGFFVNQNYIVTASHVVHPYKYNCIYDIENETCIPLELVAYDKDIDIAVLKFENGRGKIKVASCAVANDDAEVGDKITTYGWYEPFERNVFSIQHKKSEVFAMEGLFGDQDIDRIDTELYPGYSGGPSMNWEGKVVGLSRAVSNIEMDVSMIVKASRINEFLEKNNIGVFATTKSGAKCSHIIVNSQWRI